MTDTFIIDNVAAMQRTLTQDRRALSALIERKPGLIATERFENMAIRAGMPYSDGRRIAAAVDEHKQAIRESLNALMEALAAEQKILSQISAAAGA